MQEDKQVDGAVSLWVGNSPSRAELERYVEIDHSTGDMSQLSQLADDFGTGYYDEDFVDTSFHDETTRSLSSLLRGCSYASLINPKFVRQCGELLPMEVNSAVLIYDFRNQGSREPASNEHASVRLHYMGPIHVDTPWPD